MSNRLRFVLPALLVVAAFAFTPAAFARSHWSVGVSFGYPGVGIGYSGYGYRGYGWGGNYYGGVYGSYYAPIRYRTAYYGPAYYGPAYYGPGYYGYGGTYYYSRPVGSVVYYDRERPRRYREVRRYDDRDDGYYGESRHGRRATYYDRDADYRR